MKYNYAAEKKHFDENQRKQAEEYRKFGMSEEDIKAMYEFDLAEFNSNRRYISHTEPMQGGRFDDKESDESKSVLFEHFIDKLSVTQENSGNPSRYWWVEKINNPDLAKSLRLLPDEDKEILTLYFIDGYVQSEISDKIGISQKGISKRLKHILKMLTKGLK